MWWDSPYINRFLQPDSIVPSPASPQSWNRYSYVHNNPVRFNDPTGHMRADENGSTKHGCNDPKYCKDRDSKGNLKIKDDKKSGADVIAKVLGVGALTLDALALGASSMGTLVEAAGLALGEAFTPVPGVDGAVGFGGAVLFYNLYINPIENWLSGVSLGMVALADVLTNQTHFQVAQNPSTGAHTTELVLGHDTTFALGSVGFGNTKMTPEAGTDSLVNAATLYYDFKRLNGETPVWGLIQYHIGHETGASALNPLSWYDYISHGK